MKKQKSPKVKYPLATVAPYGPDDETVTKIAIGIVPDATTNDVIDLERWVGTNVANDTKVAKKMYAFMRSHGVKTVMTPAVMMGCPHEEGEDFPEGRDCPFCPFWKGVQGSGENDEARWKNLKSARIERLGLSYRFWMPKR